MCDEKYINSRSLTQQPQDSHERDGKADMTDDPNHSSEMPVSFRASKSKCRDQKNYLSEQPVSFRTFSDATSQAKYSFAPEGFNCRHLASACMILTSFIICLLPFVVGDGRGTYMQCQATESAPWFHQAAFWTRAIIGFFVSFAAVLLLVRSVSMEQKEKALFACLMWAGCEVAAIYELMLCNSTPGIEIVQTLSTVIVLASYCWHMRLLHACIVAMVTAMCRDLVVHVMTRLVIGVLVFASISFIFAALVHVASWMDLRPVSYVFLMCGLVLYTAFGILVSRALYISLRCSASVAAWTSGHLMQDAILARSAARAQLIGVMLSMPTNLFTIIGNRIGDHGLLDNSEELKFFAFVVLQALGVVCNTLSVLGLSWGLVTGNTLATQKRIKAEQARKAKRACMMSEWCPSEHPPWQEKVQELASRGFTLEALLRFYAGLGVEYMEHFQPSVHTTNDVVRQSIIPLSRERKCAYASIMMDQKPTYPQKMVTHGWNNIFCDLVAAIIADALDEQEFSRISHLLKEGHLSILQEWVSDRGCSQNTYWVCAFSISQHDGICGGNPRHDKDPVTGREHPICPCDKPKYFNNTEPSTPEGRSINCEMNKFDDMVAYLAATDENFAQVVAIDAQFELFSRAWCVAELVAADNMGVRQSLKMFSEATLHEHEASLHKLRVQDMQASRPEDVQEILDKIPDKEMFNRKLQKQIFDEHSGLLALWIGLDNTEQMERLGKIARWEVLVRARSPSKESDLTPVSVCQV